jgi:hypothetical protein
LPPNDGGWQVNDTITPTLDAVEWREEGEYLKALERISDGRWFFLGCRLYLVKSEYLIATFSENFNWTLVKSDLEAEERYYTSFDEFRDDIENDPRWWLGYSWKIDTEWFGISLDQTTVIIDYNAETSRVRIRIWCHIHHIPNFFLMSVYMANRRLKPLFAGFDLSDVHIGVFEELEWYETYTQDITRYRVYYKAPAHLLSLYGTEYSFALPTRDDQISTVTHEITGIMPSDTQVQSTSPVDLASHNENTAIFAVHQGQVYPNSFVVTSGPPIKEFSQIFLENITYWITDPSYWVVFGTFVAIVYGAFSGKRMWDRRKTYYRLYRSMVKTYDLYSHDDAKFFEEIAVLYNSITQCFIENKINDDQFDRLLSRRDDLIERIKENE